MHFVAGDISDDITEICVDCGATLDKQSVSQDEMDFQCPNDTFYSKANSGISLDGLFFLFTERIKQNVY
jgi:hypothetical protein